jgi:hypothetical protein
MNHVLVEVVLNLKNVALKIMSSICYNNIHVTYFDETIEEKIKTSRILHKELYENDYLEYPEYYNDEDEYELITEFEIESKWVAPLQFFQHLCNKYNIDIIGVAFNFDNGYVESFELKNQLVEEEIKTQQVLNFVENNDKVETIYELPKSQDDEFLDAECPADLDPEKLDLSDKEISEL